MSAEIVRDPKVEDWETNAWGQEVTLLRASSRASAQLLC